MTCLHFLTQNEHYWLERDFKEKNKHVNSVCRLLPQPFDHLTTLCDTPINQILGPATSKRYTCMNKEPGVALDLHLQHLSGKGKCTEYVSRHF